LEVLHQEDLGAGVVEEAQPGARTSDRRYVPDALRREHPHAIGNFIEHFALLAAVDGIRFYIDPAVRVYCGYELQARPLGNGQFNIIVEALGLTLFDLTPRAKSNFGV